jgi:alcohol dehydrogenase
VAYSRAAFSMLAAAFPRVLADPSDVEHRAAMQLGAALAGTAIENSMLGATHSAANPLTAHFDTVHGEAVGMLLPHVVRFNDADPAAAAEYAQLASRAGVDSLPEFLASLLEAAGLPSRMPDGTLTNENVPPLSREAAAQWTAQFNPRPVGAHDFEAFYAAVM